MALSEVYGLERFSEYMKGLEDCYAGKSGEIGLRTRKYPPSPEWARQKHAK